MPLLIKKRASVLMVSLWVLLILTMLAVSVGHRVSMALKLAQYQRDGVNAAFLAKAGINRAISVIDSDQDNYDALNEPWAGDESLFKKITFGVNEDEFASVSYAVADGGITKTIFGTRDEESMINIQLASKRLLIELCGDCYSDTAQLDKLADYIQLWRGRGDNDGSSLPSFGDKDKDFKKASLSNPEELLVVLEYFFRDSGYEDFRKKARDLFACIRDKVTIWGDGKININTVLNPVLRLFIRSLAQDNNEAMRTAPLAEEIIGQRDKNLSEYPNQAPFKEAGDLGTANLDSVNLLNRLKSQVSFSEAKYFRIQATGTCAKVNRGIVAVYNRPEKKIVYWHEN